MWKAAGWMDGWPRCLDVTGNEEAPFEGLLKRVPKGGGVALFEERKTTKMSINHRWSAEGSRFHHVSFLLAKRR